MADPVLLSRLRALWNNLAVVIANLEGEQWRPKDAKDTKDTRVELLQEKLWIGMESTITRAIQYQQFQLTKEIHKLLTPTPGTTEVPKAAWMRYDRIMDDSECLLRECLEIIGTLAIRNKDLDNKILHLADEVIGECLTLTTGTLDYYLTVHGLGDTFPAQKAHIIRMRFPEWTIWDLPLAAHELGHVLTAIILGREAVEDDPLRFLTSFLTEQQDVLINKDTQLKQLLVSEDPELKQNAKEWAASRVRKFVADAFATFTMGPAYACSAINLRFNPYVEVQRDTPSDAQRAHIVISMLERMDEYARLQVQSNPYESVLAKLNDAWETTMGRSDSNSQLAASDKAYLKKFTDRFAEICPNILNKTAMYPMDGWYRALQWQEEWRKQQDAGELLSIPKSKVPVGKLRDVLNATWLYRLASDDFTEIISKHVAQVGRDLCGLIIAAPPGRGRIPPSTGQ